MRREADRGVGPGDTKCAAGGLTSFLTSTGLLAPPRAIWRMRRAADFGAGPGETAFGDEDPLAGDLRGRCDGIVAALDGYSGAELRQFPAQPTPVFADALRSLCGRA